MTQGQELVQALTLGKLEGLPEEIVFLYARTGLVHVFSAAGFHLWAARAVADMLSFPLRHWLPPGRPRRVAGFAARLLLMTYFAMLTDWSAPMVRAFVFAALSSGAFLLEIKSNRHWIFLLSLLCSAVIGKGGTLSFLLSAAGIGGALYIQPRRPWAILLGPWLFTLPLTIWAFGLFSPLAPLWNLTFGFLISWLVMPLAILLLMGKSLGLPTETLDTTTAFLMEKITAALDTCANFAGSAVWVRPLPWAVLSVAFLLTISIWRARIHPRAAVSIALAGITASLAIPLPSLSVLDVGQGDGIFVHTDSARILEDVGPPGTHGYSAPVCRSLEGLGQGDLDDIMLSHFDLDHRGGLDSLLIRHHVRNALWFREENLQVKNQEKVLFAAERAGVPIRFLTGESAPRGIRCWLAPFATGNDSSPLCRAQLQGGRTVLLTGDMSEKAEAWFIRALRPFPQAEILKVAHHGSASSSSEDFLRASGAQEALISVGFHNRYHHPSPEALSRLVKTGMQVRRTDREGSINEYDWRKLDYFSKPFTDEIMRPLLTETSRVNPGKPATASRL